MTPEEIAAVIFSQLRLDSTAGKHLDQLVAMAKAAPGIPGPAIQTRIRELVRESDRGRGNISSQERLERLTRDLMRLAGQPPTHAAVILFKPGGKYYTEESWRIPEGAIGPWDMANSPDFTSRPGWFVLVPDQEPWGYPFLIVPGPETR